MKKIAFIILALVAIIGLATPAFAVVAVTDFDSIFTTGSEGSTTPKTTFGWNETPWLYVKLTSSALNLTTSWWLDPNSNPLGFSMEEAAKNEFWLTPTDEYGQNIWNSIKATGTWTINAEAHFATIGNDKNTGSATFTVTPEPVSSVLFLLGAAGLAGSKMYRSKRKS